VLPDEGGGGRQEHISARQERNMEEGEGKSKQPIRVQSFERRWRRREKEMKRKQRTPRGMLFGGYVHNTAHFRQQIRLTFHSSSTGGTSVAMSKTHRTAWEACVEATIALCSRMSILVETQTRRHIHVHAERGRNTKEKNDTFFPLKSSENAFFVVIVWRPEHRQQRKENRFHMYRGIS
jgi:hypothetical protein